MAGGIRRRTVLAAIALAAAGIAGAVVPATAHAGTFVVLSTPADGPDKRSHDPGGGGHHTPPPPPPPPSPSATDASPPTPTSTPTTDPPTTTPTDVPASAGNPAPPPSTGTGGVTSGVAVPAAQPSSTGGGAGQPAGSGSSDSGGGPVMLGRSLPVGGTGIDSVPVAAPALAPTDTVRIGDTAMPLWLIVGGGGLLLVLLAVGLALTLRDRQPEPDSAGLAILNPPDPPASVKFG